jgi:putative addiction module killer protein
MATILYYVDLEGGSPFEVWFSGLEQVPAAKVTVGIKRLAEGNVSKVKSVGEGVAEIKIDWGPGYRVYFGRDGTDIVILLSGGTKKSQADDIKHAKSCWQDYKKRKKKLDQN